MILEKMQANSNKILEKVQDLCSRIKYKPNSIILTRQAANYPGIEISIAVPCISATDFSATIPIITSQAISYDELNSVKEDLEPYILSRIYSLITRLELHEINEFFKIDGRYYKHPHPPNMLTYTINNLNMDK